MPQIWLMLVCRFVFNSRKAIKLSLLLLSFFQIAKLGLNVASCQAFAKKQIGYALGDAGRSYLVGFGTNYPLQPHHRGASCPQIPAAVCGWTPYNAATANPHIIVGALVGGPDASDNYSDVRSNYQQGEVACDYNAGFTSAVAGLLACNC